MPQSDTDCAETGYVSLPARIRRALGEAQPPPPIALAFMGMTALLVLDIVTHWGCR